MGEDFEAVAARDRDQRDAGVLRGAHGERGRRRDGDDDRRADASPPSAPVSTETRLVSSTTPCSAAMALARQARRRACRARCGGRRPRAAQRAAPAAIQKAAAWTARVSLIERLRGAAARPSPSDQGVGVHRSGRCRRVGSDAHRLLQALDAAEAAAGRAGHDSGGARHRLRCRRAARAACGARCRAS